LVEAEWMVTNYRGVVEVVRKEVLGRGKRLGGTEVLRYAWSVGVTGRVWDL
jgi:hypothetical protein